MDDWLADEFARQDAKIQRVKRPLIDAVLTAAAEATKSNELGVCSDEEGTSRPQWSLQSALPLFRLLAADHRELWELLDVPSRCAARLFQKPISCWNEQQTCKWMWYWLEWGLLTDPSACSWRRRVRDELEVHMTRHISPRAAEPLQLPKRCDLEGSSSHLSSLALDTLGNDARVFVTPMEYETRPTQSKNATSCSAPTATAESDDDDDDSTADKLVAVSVEGSLWCRSPVATMSTVLEVPRAHLFTISTLRSSGRCAFFDALEQCPALNAVLEQEETMLVLCLVFERFFRKEESWWWRPLLERCPLLYPTVPTCWSLEELSELEGSDLIDQVLEKKDALTRFHGEVVELIDHFAQPAVAMEIESTISREAAQRFATTWQKIFSLEHLHWARATCDSRAFHLNIDGTEALALVPVADMVNHALHTDILVRKVLPNDGPFVALCGAGLTASCDVGRELWMSYGPLQNWELLLSYGFVLGDENENDKVPFPLQLDNNDEEVSEPCVPASETNCGNEGTAYAARRQVLIDRYGLNIGAGYWIGRDGVPCPALLALLRLQLAEIDEFSLLKAHSVFEAVSVELEQRVAEVIRGTISAMYDDYSTTVAEDEALLRRHAAVTCRNCVEAKEDEPSGSEEEEEVEGAPLSQNAMLAVRLRLSTKRILDRVLQWCDRPIQL